MISRDDVCCHFWSERFSLVVDRTVVVDLVDRFAGRLQSVGR
jgi:hypothetical protein